MVQVYLLQATQQLKALHCALRRGRRGGGEGQGEREGRGRGARRREGKGEREGRGKEKGRERGGAGERRYSIPVLGKMVDY